MVLILIEKYIVISFIELEAVESLFQLFFSSQTTQKKRGILSFTAHPALVGLRKAILLRISNAEAHAVCKNKYTNPWTLNIALPCSRLLKLRSSQEPQIRR